MAMNPQSVLADLRMMSDQQLQQYAAMHKNDPFVFPLAFQESQMRKQMRSEAQAMQPPQAKVADQALASMMPEDVGIGALPVQNLEGMAAGGIVAFDEGGEVPRYQGLGPSLVRLPPSTDSLYGIPGMQLQGSFIPQEGTYDDRTLYEKLKGYNPRVSKGTKEQMEMAAFDDATRRFMQDRDAKQQAVAAAIKGTTQPPSPTPPTAIPPRPALSADNPTMLPSAAPGVPTAKDMRARLDEIIGTTPAVDPFKTEREQINESGLAAARKQQQMLEEEIAARGEAFKGREERLSKREEKITKDTDQNAGLAFLEAGLAIMGGSSPFALQNVALGTKGIEAYAKGKEKIDAARERLDDARDRIEEYRRNEDMMNSRERRQAQAGIDNLITQGKRDMLQGAEQAYGRQTQLGTAVFGALNQAENVARTNASHEKIAGMQIAAHKDIAAAQPERMIWDSLLKANNNDPTAAYQAMTKLKTEKFNVFQSYADYLKAFAGKENVLTPPKDFVEYASQFNVPSYKSNALPDNPNIRKLPN